MYLFLFICKHQNNNQSQHLTLWIDESDIFVPNKKHHRIANNFSGEASDLILDGMVVERFDDSVKKG
jgi:hypothetical protein